MNSVDPLGLVTTWAVYVVRINVYARQPGGNAASDPIAASYLGAGWGQRSKNGTQLRPKDGPGDPANNGQRPGLRPQPAGMIEDENKAFEQCVKEGALRAVGVGVTTTFWDRKSNPNPVVNVGEAALDLQAECLAEHPLAAADPNYKGLFLPGNPQVDPIIEILGWKF